MAEEQSCIFITGPAAIDMSYERAKVDRLAGKPREARVLTRAAINLVNQADKDIDPGDRMGLAVAYARLGEERAEMREFATATEDMRRSHADLDIGIALALIQLELGTQAAAIHPLQQHMSLAAKS